MGILIFVKREADAQAVVLKNQDFFSSFFFHFLMQTLQ